MNPLLLKILGPLALVLAIAAAGGLADHRVMAPRLERWKATADENAKAARAWEASFRQSESLRDKETAEAVAAYNHLSAQCDARVAAARKQALAIHALIEKDPPRDPHGCPVRQLVDPDGLRDALGAR